VQVGPGTLRFDNYHLMEGCFTSGRFQSSPFSLNAEIIPLNDLPEGERKSTYPSAGELLNGAEGAAGEIAEQERSWRKNGRMRLERVKTHWWCRTVRRTSSRIHSVQKTARLARREGQNPWVLQE
jgi:hypothetical protein